MKKFIFPVLSFFIFSCQQEDNVGLTNDITVEEVIEYYNENYRDIENSRSDNQIFYGFEINWIENQLIEISIGQALIFPVDYDSSHQFHVNNGPIYPIEDKSYIIAYRNDEMNIHIEMVKVLPESSNPEFDGWVMVENMNYELIRLFGYSDNTLTEYAFEFSDETSSREEASICSLSIAYVGHPVYGWVEQPEYNCIIVSVLPDGGGSGLDGTDYSPSYGGGGGGPVSLPGQGADSCSDCDMPGYECLDGICRSACISGIRNEYGKCIICPSYPCCDLSEEERIRCLDAIPCMGDPLDNMQIVSSGGSGTNGGRYGCTRFGSGCDELNNRKFHDGIDLTAPIGGYVFAAFPGEVVQIRNSYDPLEYGKNSYGNYVIIESEQYDGTKFRMQYNHLDNVGMVIGQSVRAGMLLGNTGATGNASARNVTPHLHLRAFVQSGGTWQKANPENFLATAYDENGQVAYDPCLN